MNVTTSPLVDRFSASSDLELKLVTIRCGSIGTERRTRPSGAISSRKIGEVTPKLPSTVSLSQTLFGLPGEGNNPLAIAGTPALLVPPHFAVDGHCGGNNSPTVTVDAVPRYTLRETSRLFGLNSTPSSLAKTGAV